MRNERSLYNVSIIREPKLNFATSKQWYYRYSILDTNIVAVIKSNDNGKYLRLFSMFNEQSLFLFRFFVNVFDDKLSFYKIKCIIYSLP